jgi:hypothetical protein
VNDDDHHVDAVAWRLNRLVTASIHYYDRRMYDDLVPMFTPDAVYVAHDRTAHGHPGIRKTFDARRGPELTGRHLVTNLHVHSVTHDSAVVEYCLTAFAGPTPADGGPTPYPPSQAGHIVQVTDRCIRDGDAWRIAHRDCEDLLVPAPPGDHGVSSS